MDKTQLDLCLEVLRMFNKSKFDVTGIELVQFARTLESFGKLIKDGNEKLANPIKIIEDKNKLNGKSK